jgi:predicted RNA binding protein YcfA (HicA-like mRNA interferase family)
MYAEVLILGQRDKLINEILKLNRNLRFDDLAKILIRMGYVQNQPKGGSSHYTFRKDGKMPITLPKATPMNKAYVEMVKNAVMEYESEVE